MSDIIELIANRSSTRGYTEEKLSKELIDILLKAGLAAPTAANKQEIHFSVVDGKNPILSEIEAEKNKLRDIAPEKSFYFDAPVVIFLSADKEFYWSPVDAGIAVENITLAAEGLGLGSLIIGCIRDALRGEKESYFAKELAFPEGYRYEVAIAVGYKAVTKEPHSYDVSKNVTYVTSEE